MSSLPLNCTIDHKTNVKRKFRSTDCVENAYNVCSSSLISECILSYY